VSETPKTDSKAQFFGFNPDEGEEFVQADFARELERENAALRKEMDEQARLNGKGSEREAALLAEVETLERQKALQGLHLATMADVVLGENAEDRSDETLVREVCKMAREHAARKAQPCQS